MDKKWCKGCRNNFYNQGGECWSLKGAKVVWRVKVGKWERPPYLDDKGKGVRKMERVPACFHNVREVFVEKDRLDGRGYWK